MSTTLYVLHSAAFAAQLGGGGLVVYETTGTLRNVRSLRNGLIAAEQKKQDHLTSLEQIRTSMPGFGGGRISLPRVTPETRERLVEQVGPGAVAERAALRQFLEGQFPGDRKWVWLGVFVLLLGIVLGYVANMLSVGA
ncbi:hypothetical protein AB6N35_00125 [Dietzia cinnamea]|uniref:Transmembrane protein n=1 Tax=Dietzia cinnamea TaxID=321318 RepID=A0ABV3YE03_9ACTN